MTVLSATVESGLGPPPQNAEAIRRFMADRTVVEFRHR